MPRSTNTIGAIQQSDATSIGIQVNLKTSLIVFNWVN